MIFRLDLDGVRRYASPACRDILGDEPEQLVGRRPAEQIHPDDRQEVTATFDALPAGRVDRAVLVNRLGRRDGSWSWVEAKLRLVRDRQGGPLEIVGSLSDISARRAAEQRWPRTRRTTV
jgi:PAS domain S-box-containing protein